MPKLKKKYTCTCPPRQRVCTCRRGKFSDCKDVSDVIDILERDDELRNKKNIPPPKLKFTPPEYKPKHYKDTCVPMHPSMHTRLRFIAHCDPKPAKSRRVNLQRESIEEIEMSSSDDTVGILREHRKKFRTKKVKRVQYSDLSPCDIELPTPVPAVVHSTSDRDILKVPSPKTSGAIISAQRATVKADEVVTPLPPKSATALFRPHSGIFLNRDNEFVPDVVDMPGPSKLPKPLREKMKSCHNKGGVCLNKTCRRKKCRKYAMMRKKRLERRRIREYSEKPCMKLGPKKKSRRRQRDDDSNCGLDDGNRPEQVQIPANLKRGTLQSHSLTALACRKDRRAHVHYGILTGTFNMYDAKFNARSRGKQALPVSVMAYCLAFHYHPKQWTMKLVDNLVEAGDKWYLECLEKVHDHSAVQGMCEVLPFGKKQTLNLNGKKMQVLLGEPEIVGYTMSMDPTVYNLCRGLKAFFNDNRAGVMLTRVLKIVIWKDKVCFYIFDAAGRDSRAMSNFSNGCSALINVMDLQSLAEIILARTVVEDQKFVLAPVKVLRMADERDDEDFESDKELTQAERAMMGYRILDENCAIVNANMHLGDRCFEDARYRQALPIAVVAMTYAKISPPNTWHSKTLDKILRLGNKLYVDCSHPKTMVDLVIDNIPNEIIIGPYACEIIIYREKVKGQLFTPKECLFNIETGLKEFFGHEMNCGIVEFNNYALAVWRQKDMLYVLDPYPRGAEGGRAMRGGRACALMLLSPAAMADVFAANWGYLPASTQFYIHGFKVLKLKKKDPKMKIVCTLSDEKLPSRSKVKRQILETMKGHGDAREIFHDVMPADATDGKDAGAGMPQLDEDQMGDIVSLVDSIQEDYIPSIPLRYKNPEPDDTPPKVANLDSPTVSVTQVVPPWPRPRDKTNEPPEPDPDPEPTPPPTPPPPPEGAGEEEEGGEEEMDEEQLKLEAVRKAEEEEARRKAEELPPPLPPPPPSPQPEPELAPIPTQAVEDEMEALEPVSVERKILLTEDAKRRFKLRQLRRKMTPPLAEDQMQTTASQELLKLSNFKTLPDSTQIIKGKQAIPNQHGQEVMPFTAIMAIVTSFKYSINTWTSDIVTFVVETSKELHQNKQNKFQFSPVHVIPRITIGHQTYQAIIDVVIDGATWQLEEILRNKFFTKYDRGMLTTCNYSCAIFCRNGLFYLYDPSPCSAMGLRLDTDKGVACLMRFRTIHDLTTRVLYNKNGKKEDQQFILSCILVRRLLTEPRLQLPEDYDYLRGAPGGKGKAKVVAPGRDRQLPAGYRRHGGRYVITGSTGLGGRSALTGVSKCHFVSVVAMLMAAMHPVRTWDRLMVDTCVEKGLEIYDKATNLAVCEKRAIRNVILDGKFINLNVKRLIVVNENAEKTLDQYVRAVLRRLRYVIVAFSNCNVVVCQRDGYYHLFDPYAHSHGDSAPASRSASATSATSVTSATSKTSAASGGSGSTGRRWPSRGAAAWTLYSSLGELVEALRSLASDPDSPAFYTFELTSMKTAPKHSALDCKLSPLFKPDANPNEPYVRRRRERPVVDEKMYWLAGDGAPWSRTSPVNEAGFPRRSPRALWHDWDIELAGDLYSVWGALHPRDERFPAERRGRQYLATSVAALAMTRACALSAWTGNLLDGVVIAGDEYHARCAAAVGNRHNAEVSLADLPASFDGMYPYSFTCKFQEVIFGFVYEVRQDRFNLSRALLYFFEKHDSGVLVSPRKNLSFGREGASYFMFDCQTYGYPAFAPNQGAAYLLKCESLNRLIYCITLTLNIRRFGQQFHLYSADIKVTEKTK